MSVISVKDRLVRLTPSPLPTRAQHQPMAASLPSPTPCRQASPRLLSAAPAGLACSARSLVLAIPSLLRAPVIRSSLLQSLSPLVLPPVLPIQFRSPVADRPTPRTTRQPTLRLLTIPISPSLNRMLATSRRDRLEPLTRSRLPIPAPQPPMAAPSPLPTPCPQD